MSYDQLYGIDIKGLANPGINTGRYSLFKGAFPIISY